MQLTLKKPKQRAPRTLRARVRQTDEQTEATDEQAQRPSPERVATPQSRSERRGDGPQDRALYSCACGYVFTAAVATDVGCPHCGTEQAW